MAEQSIKDKTVKGVAWSGIDNVAQYLVSFFVSLILARLLTPDDYGLLGIIAVFTAVSNALIVGGFGAAIIRKLDPTEDDYNTVFVLNIGMSIVLYVLIYICSPYIAAFFGRHELVALTRVSCLSLLIDAPAMVQVTRLTKRIDFKSQTKITITTSIISGIVGLSMAFGGYGVWSLVAQSLVGGIVKTIMLFHVNMWIPKFSFSFCSFYELFGFGWKLTISRILDTVWRELYQVVVGKFYSPAALGQYTRAHHFAQLFSNNITQVVQRVTFPVLSDIQNNKNLMVLGYRKIIKMTMFITLICMSFLGAMSQPLIYCLIGPQWDEAAAYLPFLCITGSIYPLIAINLNMLQVQGRSDLFLIISVINKIIGILPLSICIFWGILPMLYVAVVTTTINFIMISHFTGKLISYNTSMQIKDIFHSFQIAVIIVFSIYFLKYLPITYWIILVIQVVTGCIVLLLICQKTQMEEYVEIKRLLLPLINKLKSIIQYNGKNKV